MKLFIYILILLSSVCQAQTRSIVPYADGQGSVGRTNKQWQAGYFENVIVNGTNLNTRISSNQVFTFNALTGSVELVAGDGVQIVTNGNQLRIQLTQIPTTAIGTNRVYFRASGYTNFWTVPPNVSNISFWVWGAGGTGGSGSSAGGAAGFSFCSLSVTGETVVTLVVGASGGVSSTSATFSVSSAAFPNGGRGVSRLSGRAGGGGASSHVFINTNLIVVAGGGGGGGAGAGSGTAGFGGGLTGTGGASQSSGIGGGGASQTDGGSTGSTTVPLFWTNRAGAFLSGGDAGSQTNLINQASAAGGGGGGYYGGGGGLIRLDGDLATGGGGSGYISPSSYGGVTIRAISQSTANASELPEYISGIGVGGSVGLGSGGNGLIVIGY